MSEVRHQLPVVISNTEKRSYLDAGCGSRPLNDFIKSDLLRANAVGVLDMVRVVDCRCIKVTLCRIAIEVATLQKLEHRFQSLQ